MREVVGGRPALRRLALRRAGSASTGTSSVRSRMAPAEAELLALCDQDDRWYPEKLDGRCARRSGSAQLVYSDQRLVDADGRVLRETLWKGRRNNHTDLALDARRQHDHRRGDAVPARAGRARAALPRHRRACSSTTTGSASWRSRRATSPTSTGPLYDYVQHAGAIFGDVAGGADGGAQPPRGAPARSSDASGAARRLLPRLPAARGAGPDPARAAARAGSPRPSGARCAASSRADSPRRLRLARAAAAARAGGPHRDARKRARARPRASSGGGWSTILRGLARRRGRRPRRPLSGPAQLRAEAPAPLAGRA